MRDAVRTAIAWPVLLALVGVKVGIHALSSGPLAWGWMTDELYFLDSVGRLDWGFVDHPPLSIALLVPLTALFGDSITAIRILPTLFSAGAVLLTGLLARELGGGRTAQGLAALAILVSPVHLSMGTYHSMNPIDHAIWPLAMLLVVRILGGASPRLWLAVGAVFGLGLLNKVSALWLGAGIALGLIFTSGRRQLATPWPWAAGLIALAIFSPFLLWQQAHGWPFLEFSRNAAVHKVGEVSPLRFFLEQVYVMNPVTAPLWVGGLVYGFVGPTARRTAPVAWIFVAAFAILAFSGSARVHYLAPAVPAAFAAGAIAVERMSATRPGLARMAATAFAIGGIVSLPLSVPLLSPSATVAYSRALGLGSPQEAEGSGALPLHLALFLHTEALLEPVTRVYESLPADDQARAKILTGSFGETGAVNVVGRKRGLPCSIGRHNQYWLWGPGETTGEPMIVVHDQQDRKGELARWFRDCRRAAEIDCPFCMPMFDERAVFVCREPTRPITELWPELKVYR